MSILITVKKSLGIDQNDEAFDTDILMHLNSVLSTLNQIGIGPDDGFEVADNTATWEDFLGVEPRLNLVKSYVHLKVRLLFDPPATSFAIDAIKTQITEYEWRINVVREVDLWVPVVPEL